jgi:hypothetical protein
LNEAIAADVLHSLAHIAQAIACAAAGFAVAVAARRRCKAFAII